VRKDVWRLCSADQAKATFQVQFGEYGGSYVNHCHNTAHEDFALLMRTQLLSAAGPQVAVTPTPNPTPDGAFFTTSEILPEGDPTGGASGWSRPEAQHGPNAGPARRPKGAPRHPSDFRAFGPRQIRTRRAARTPRTASAQERIHNIRRAGERADGQSMRLAGGLVPLQTARLAWRRRPARRPMPGQSRARRAPTCKLRLFAAVPPGSGPCDF
jgi:hypothetical protein